MTAYVLSCRVERVFEHFTQRHIRGSGKEAEFEPESQGWFISLDVNFLTLYIGQEKPSLEKGDRVKITIQKEST